MKKPTGALEWLRGLACAGLASSRYAQELIAYLDSIPEWPADLTRERLEKLANEDFSSWSDRSNALRRLAAIAPKRGKRKVEIWESPENQLRCFNMAPPRNFQIAPGWRKVGEVEIDA